MLKNYIFIILVIVFTLNGCSSEPVRPINLKNDDYSYAKKYLSWMINNEMQKHNVKGLSIAIVDGERIVWSEGFGYANVNNNVLATSDTIYHIGSISKIFTAVEIMKLVDEKKINLDDSVSKYIENYFLNTRFSSDRHMTIRDILTHHSGLPSNHLRGMWSDNPGSLDNYINDIQKDELTIKPGEMYRYSNVGYGVLGYLIEKIRHDKYESVLDTDVFKTLRMNSSSIGRGNSNSENFSKGYRNQEEVSVPGLRELSAGGITSSVNDMARFVRYIINDNDEVSHKILSPDALKLMFRPQYDKLQLDFGHEIGLAWMLSGLSVNGSDRVAWHNGGYPPYQAHLSVLPNEKLGVIILSNTDSASKFITQVGEKALQILFDMKTGERHLVDNKQSTQGNHVTVEKTRLEELAGKYVAFQQIVPINADVEKLKINIWGTELDLISIDNKTFMPQKSILGLFSIAIPDLSLEFNNINDKSIAVLRGFPAPIPFEKITEYSIPDSWRSRLGSYITVNPTNELTFNDFHLIEEDGLLVVKTTLHSSYTPNNDLMITIALNPLSDTEALIVGLGLGEGDVINVEQNNGQEQLYYSGFLFEKLH